MKNLQPADIAAYNAQFLGDLFMIYNAFMHFSGFVSGAIFFLVACSDSSFESTPINNSPKTLKKDDQATAAKAGSGSGSIPSSRA